MLCYSSVYPAFYIIIIMYNFNVNRENVIIIIIIIIIIRVFCRGTSTLLSKNGNGFTRNHVSTMYTNNVSDINNKYTSSLYTVNDLYFTVVIKRDTAWLTSNKLALYHLLIDIADLILVVILSTYIYTICIISTCVQLYWHRCNNIIRCVRNCLE
jgi:hypothetical protein